MILACDTFNHYRKFTLPKYYTIMEETWDYRGSLYVRSRDMIEPVGLFGWPTVPIAKNSSQKISFQF